MGSDGEDEADAWLSNAEASKGQRDGGEHSRVRGGWRRGRKHGHSPAGPGMDGYDGMDGDGDEKHDLEVDENEACEESVGDDPKRFFYFRVSCHAYMIPHAEAHVSSLWCFRPVSKFKQLPDS